MPEVISFRALRESDLTMLHSWLCAPHVVEWWEPPPTIEQVREDYLPRLAAPEVRPLDADAGVTQYIACEGDQPFGFIQAYRVMAFQHEGWWLDESDPNALGIDQFIGIPDKLGQGLGTRMISAFVHALYADPRVTTIQTDPSPENTRAIRCYRNVGFREIGVVNTLDGEALLMKLTRQH